MKATFLIAASLIAGAAIAQTTPDTTAAPAAAPTSTDPTMAPAAAPAPMDSTAAPSAAPAMTTTASPPASTVAPPAPDTSNYPPCSRSVHDRCVQTHELARKGGATRRHR